MAGTRIAPAAEELLSVTEALWPAPARSVLIRRDEPAPGATLREFSFVPDARRPRLLIPAGAPAAAAAALRRYSHALSPAERIGRSAAAAVLRTGLADRVLPDRLRICAGSTDSTDTIDTVLAELLGQDVVVSMGLGNRRANQKPVLQVLSPGGASLAFVKVGDNEVTKALVNAEARALAQVGGLPLTRIHVPAVLALQTWNDLDLLVLSPLHTTPWPRRSRSSLPHAEFLELATAGGVTTAPLAGSAFWTALAAEVEAVPEEEVADRLRALLEAVVARQGGTELSFGAWHGDWTAWNMSWERLGLAVWDWERFETGIPLGLDALHYRMQADTVASGDPQAAGTTLRLVAADLLASLGIAADLVPLTVLLYLLKLSARFALASAGVIGAPLLERSRWLLDFVSADPLLDAP